MFYPPTLNLSLTEKLFALLHFQINIIYSFLVKKYFLSLWRFFVVFFISKFQVLATILVGKFGPNVA